MAIEDKLKKINTLQREISKQSPPFTEWDSEFMEKVKVDFTYSSNKLEGNKVTYGQTIQIWAALFMAAGLAALLVSIVGMAHTRVLARMGVKP